MSAIIPHEHDFLGGKGPGIDDHPGNMYFNDLVATIKDEYASASKKDKHIIALRVIKDIHSRTPPGKFLNKDRYALRWNLMDRQIMVKKVKIALRHKSTPMPAVKDNREVALRDHHSTNMVKENNPEVAEISNSDSIYIGSNRDCQIEARQTDLSRDAISSGEKGKPSIIPDPLGDEHKSQGLGSITEQRRGTISR